MKKLMILAAVAAMAGVASADACAPGAAKTNATVYAVKFSLKTPTGDICAVAGTGASMCAPGSTGSNKYVRKPSTYALQGWFAQCKDQCDVLKTMTPDAIALWNTKERLGMKVGTYDVSILHVLSKTQADAEIYFDLKGDMMDGSTGAWVNDTSLTRKFDLHCAGFGKYAKAQKRYTSFNGNVVGKVSKVPYPKAVNTGTAAAPVWECPAAGYWLCTAVAQGCSGLATDEESVAYGTFAINYNAAASTAYYTKGTKPTIPAYVVTPAAW